MQTATKTRTKAKIAPAPPKRRKVITRLETAPKPEVPIADKVLLTMDEAGALIHYGRTKMFQLVASGEVYAVFQGRRRMIPRHALDQYAKSLQPVA